MKNVSGRNTDVADAIWLADLLAHGLIRASFVPETATREMRALLCTRMQLVLEQASHVPPLQKTLQDANLKFASLLTDIMGLSGRAILEALLEGARDPDRLLTPVRRGVKAPVAGRANPCIPWASARAGCSCRSPGGWRSVGAYRRDTAAIPLWASHGMAGR